MSISIVKKSAAAVNNYDVARGDSALISVTNGGIAVSTNRPCAAAAQSFSVNAAMGAMVT